MSDFLIKGAILAQNDMYYKVTKITVSGIFNQEPNHQSNSGVRFLTNDGITMWASLKDDEYQEKIISCAIAAQNALIQSNNEAEVSIFLQDSYINGIVVY